MDSLRTMLSMYHPSLRFMYEKEVLDERSTIISYYHSDYDRKKFH